MAQMTILVREQFQAKTQLEVVMSMLRAVNTRVGCTVSEITRSILKVAVTHEGMRRCIE
jgi:hypothetical protein